MFAKEIINGCYEDGAALLTRYKILVTKYARVYFHRFHRSDEDRELHDHPWSFVSFILAGGYTEVRPNATVRAALRAGVALESVHITDSDLERVRIRPFRVLIRPSWWAHRIEIEAGASCTTLVFCLRKSRDWGFFTKHGWRPWRAFLSARDCG